MSDTMLHCFACDTFTVQTTQALECAQCQSDFVEIVQVERSPAGMGASSAVQRAGSGAANAQNNGTPDFSGMLSNLLSSILPTESAASQEGTSSASDPQERPTDDSSTTAPDQTHEDDNQPPNPPRFNDIFSQMFRNFSHGDSNNTPSGQSTFTRTGHGQSGAFTFTFGSMGTPPTFFNPQSSETSDAPSRNFGFAQQRGPEADLPGDGIPQIQNFPDLASFLAQALGAVPGRAGDYASSEAFDNIITELMGRNPQSDVHAASDRAIAQIRRITLHRDGPGFESSKIGEECSICQEEYKESEVLAELQCHHIYHEECLLSWVTTNGMCPICRAPVKEYEEVPEQDILD